MSGTTYKITKEEDLVFSFVSKGPKGEIEKLIRYDQLSDDLYNLGFGDRIEDTLFFDDRVTSDNRDIRTVIATVIGTLPLFFAQHPGSYVHFRGSDERRTRFYKWIIERYLETYTAYYEIYGTRNGITELFEKGKDYEYFFIYKKQQS